MISAQPQAKVDNMAAKTRKRIGLIITNCQNIYVCVRACVRACVWVCYSI